MPTADLLAHSKPLYLLAKGFAKILILISENTKIGQLKKNLRKLNKKLMGNLSINNKALDKYFALLRRLDNSTKKKLIIRLTESLDFEKKAIDLKLLFGAWEDSRDSDEIIKEIKDSRVNKREIEDFE